MNQQQYETMLRSPDKTADYEVLSGHVFRQRKVVFVAGQVVSGLKNKEAAHWVHVNPKLKAVSKPGRMSKK